MSSTMPDSDDEFDFAAATAEAAERRRQEEQAEVDKSKKERESRRELAGQLGLQIQTINRDPNLNHDTKMELMQAAMAALVGGSSPGQPASQPSSRAKPSGHRAQKKGTQNGGNGEQPADRQDDSGQTDESKGGPGSWIQRGKAIGKKIEKSKTWQNLQK